MAFGALPGGGSHPRTSRRTCNSSCESQRQRHMTCALWRWRTVWSSGCTGPPTGWPTTDPPSARGRADRDRAIAIITENAYPGVDINRLDESALAELPVLTKAEVMEHFDDIVTDGRLKLAGLDQYLNGTETGSYLLGRYTAITSGG